MGKTATVVLVTVLVAIPAFLLAPAAPLGPAIWPAPVQLTPPPTPAQVKLFQVLGVFEALSLGLGVSFLILGWPAMQRAAGPSRRRAFVMYLGVAWLLANWWLHDGFHMVAGLNPGGLLWIEYGFHVTLILAGAALAYGFATMGRESRVR